MSCLSDIFLALLLALLLGRAVRVEVVELAAGEHLVVGPVAVCFLGGSLNTLDASRWPVADGGRGRDASSLKQARGRGRLRSVVDEVRDFGLVETERLRCVFLGAEAAPRRVADAAHHDDRSRPAWLGKKREKPVHLYRSTASILRMADENPSF